MTSAPDLATRMEEMKPCPFCGGAGILDSDHHAIAPEYVGGCRACDFSLAFQPSRELAISVWNTRAPDLATRIVGVALRIGNVILSALPPARHHTLLMAHYTLAHTDRRPVVHPAPEDQGFLTNEGRFVGRTEALQIAVAAGQMIERKPGQYDGPDLYSEDLW